VGMKLCELYTVQYVEGYFELSHELAGGYEAVCTVCRDCVFELSHELAGGYEAVCTVCRGCI
jgi:hypothetical protein